MINGFLLCLKIFHARRFEFIKDFNEALKSVVLSPLSTPLIIFTLSDSQDRLSSFHSKLFVREILQLRGESFFVLNLNAPTEKSIDKVLKIVAEGEELCMGDGQLVDIRNQCNKDLRNAIITLQFMAAGRTMEGLLHSQHSVQRKVLKSKRTAVVQESDEDDEFMQFMTSKKGNTSKADPSGDQAKLILMKDNPFTIFHALGKFLYNKSNNSLSLILCSLGINPKTGKTE